MQINDTLKETGQVQFYWGRANRKAASGHNKMKLYNKEKMAACNQAHHSLSSYLVSCETSTDQV